MKFKLRHCGTGIQFNPYCPDRIAASTADNFGVVGRGWQSVLHRGQNGLEEIWGKGTQEGVVDCCWSETRNSILVGAFGDGSIHVWETDAKPEDSPVSILREHTRDVSSVRWSIQRQNLFLSTSWDKTVKLWKLGEASSLYTFHGHQYCVYMSAWNPSSANIFGTVSGDQTLKIWDTRHPAPTLSLQAHNAEVLCVDWCKYNDCVLVTGSVDKLIRTWDVRAPTKPVAELAGHRYAVRKIVFSPDSENLILSCSYDMSVRLWDISAGVEDSLLKVWDHHTEFVIGVDFSVFETGVIGSVGWDELLFMWHLDGEPWE